VPDRVPLSSATARSQLCLPAGELGDIHWELMEDDLRCGPQDIGLVVRAVLAVQLLLGSLVEVHQRP
jgi:hypothetical protein